MKKTIDQFSWSNISGDKYYDITDILNSSRSDMEKEVALISVIIGLSEDEVYNLPLSTYSSYASKLIFLNKFTYPDWKKKSINLPSFSCDVIDDITNINVTQYIDFQSFVSLPLRESYDKILSIIVIPKGHTYNNGYDINKLQEEIRAYLGWSEVQSLLDFFITASMRSLLRSLRSYNRKMKKMKDPVMKKEMEIALKQMGEKMKTLTAGICTLGCVSSKE